VFHVPYAIQKDVLAGSTLQQTIHKASFRAFMSDAKRVVFLPLMRLDFIPFAQNLHNADVAAMATLQRLCVTVLRHNGIIAGSKCPLSTPHR